MNRIFTLLTLGLLCFSWQSTKAQTVAADFNSGVPASNCWTNTDFTNRNNGGPDGSRSATSKGVATANLITPFINVPAGGTITFDYKTTDNSFNYTLTVRLISLSGNTTVTTLAITNTTYQTYTSSALPSGTYRVALDYTSNVSSQLGLHYIDIDNLSISGTYHYSSFCNQTPVAVNDTYTATSFASPTVTGNILTNDTDPDAATLGETLTVVSNSTPTSGTLVVNSNGTFSFTPNASFTGGPVTFTYTVIDNGYSPVTSNTATVTITYPAAPSAVNDGFGGPISGAAFSSNVATNDLAPSGKTLITNLVAGPSSGQVVLQNDGSFTYTPPASFTGGDVTFTYNVTYDTYMPLNSNTATVTISYPALTPTPLPIKLLSFTGQVSNNQAVLHWSVDDNETGDYFKVEKSLDGKNFTEAAIVLTTGNKGRQEYSFREPIPTGASFYYRLQIVNNDAPPTYSKTVLVKSQVNITNTTIHLATNPVQSTLRFTFTTEQPEQTFAHIYTLNGSKVFSQQLVIVKGTNTAALDINTLPKGLYVLEVTSKTTTQRIKFFK